jgi:hypothetical protein
MTAQPDTDSRIIINDLIPCIDPYCDKNGTTMDGNESEAYPAQCQYCFEVRFPLIDKIMESIAEQVAAARVDEVQLLNQALKDNKMLFYFTPYIESRIGKLTGGQE